MTTIAYCDRTAPHIVREFYRRDTLDLFTRQKKWDRIAEALRELEHVGNIIVYLAKDRKLRRLFARGY